MVLSHNEHKGAAVDIADRVELHELPGRYGDAIDDRNWAGLATIFTDDAVFDLTDLGGPRLAGLAAIQEFMATFDGHPKTHLMTNIYVDEDDGAVQLRFRIVAMLSGGKMASASYYDDVVRSAGGWRVQHRVTTRLRRPI